MAWGGNGGGMRIPFLGSMPPMKRVVAGAVGAAATRAIPGYASRLLPQIPDEGIPGLVVRALGALLAGNLAGQFLGRQFGEDMTLGGLISVADEAGRQFVYPAIGLSAYLDPEFMDAYLPAYEGMDAYINPEYQLEAGLDDDELSGGIPGRLSADNRM